MPFFFLQNSVFFPISILGNIVFLKSEPQCLKISQKSLATLRAKRSFFKVKTIEFSRQKSLLGVADAILANFGMEI